MSEVEKKFSSCVLPLTLFKGLTGFEQSVAVTSHEIRQGAIYGVCFLTTKVFFHWKRESDEIYLKSFWRFTIHCHLRSPSSQMCVFVCIVTAEAENRTIALLAWSRRSSERKSMRQAAKPLRLFLVKSPGMAMPHSRCCYARPQTCSAAYATIFARVQFNIIFLFFWSRSWLTSPITDFFSKRSTTTISALRRSTLLWTNVHVDMSIESGYSEFCRSANFQSNVVP